MLLDKMDDIDRIDNVELMINIRAFLDDYEKSVKVLMKERNNKWER